MKKFISAIAAIFVLLPATAQRNEKLATYIEFIQQRTISDGTIQNNPWGSGLGLQAILNPQQTFSPFVELSGFAYISGNKILYTDSTGIGLPSVEWLVNAFAGISFKPKGYFYFSIAGGPSFVSDQALFGIKPAVGIKLSRKWRAQLTYLNVFNRGKEGYRQNFSSIALSVGLKLF